MNLKKATSLALIGMWLNFIFRISDSLISSFNIVRDDRVYMSLNFLIALLTTLPLIIFFTVLQNKQKGESND